MKKNLPMWQITFPLGIVLIFALGAFTAIKLAHGRYTFELDASPKQVRFRTDIEKTERQPIEEIDDRTTLEKKDLLKAQP